jgi:hypothetical protein
VQLFARCCQHGTSTYKWSVVPCMLVVLSGCSGLPGIWCALRGGQDVTLTDQQPVLPLLRRTVSLLEGESILQRHRIPPVTCSSLDRVQFSGCQSATAGA